MELKSVYAQDTAGNVVPHPVATLFLVGTETPASGLVDADGGALTNPFTGTDQGLLQFSAPDGDYTLSLVAAGRTQAQRVRFTSAPIISKNFSIGCSINPPAEADEILLAYVHADATTYPANFATSQAVPIAPPTASTVYTVKKMAAGADLASATSVGSATYATDGSFAFATSGGAALNFAAGDTLLLVGQAAADATAACAITWKGQQ